MYFGKQTAAFKKKNVLCLKFIKKGLVQNQTKPNQTRQQNTLISGMFMNIFFFFVLHVHQCLNLCDGPPKAHFVI